MTHISKWLSRLKFTEANCEAVCARFPHFHCGEGWGESVWSEWCILAASLTSVVGVAWVYTLILMEMWASTLHPLPLINVSYISTVRLTECGICDRLMDWTVEISLAVMKNFKALLRHSGSFREDSLGLIGTLQSTSRRILESG